MPKSNTTKPTRKGVSRRDEVRRNLLRTNRGTQTLLEQPGFVYATLVLLGFVLLATIVIDRSRDQILVAPGQIMTDTRLNRVEFEVVNESQTESARNNARRSVGRTLVFDEGFRARLEQSLTALPRVVAGASALDEIDKTRMSYALDESAIEQLTVFAEAEGRNDWTRWVDRLLSEVLPHRPIVGKEEHEAAAAGQAVDLWSPDVPGSGIITWDRAVGLFREGGAEEETRNAVRGIAEEAGFPPGVARYVAAKIVSDGAPSFVLDTGTQLARAEQAAAQVGPVYDKHRPGEVIYRRGEVLDAGQLGLLRAEVENYADGEHSSRRWLERLGLFGLIGLLVGFAYWAILISYPRIARNVVRVVALCVLMLGMLALTAILAEQVPKLVLPAAVASSVFVSIIVLLSYDQRLALFLSAMQCALLTLALNQGITWFMLLVLGCGVMIGQLHDVRHRNTLIRAAFGTAIALGVATLLHGVATSPPVDGIMVQIMGDAAWAMVAAVMIGFFVLGILPSIEKVFDITTGMTLAELRDPSQPLLRQLQQRAPGTYNHSLQVANIAEAGAEAIGADSLLVYVGGLYHDVGKMNKPEYFVENQAGGFNKHSKLRPAMSLLVIIGHVKDGIELAREYGLPRQIQHFIGSHHGTTLVEYFFHAAKSEAEADRKKNVDEVEFRYPGPRPRTREAAILMLSDAVESASRAMTEPTPSRVEHLVRELSRKRLLDGQFDECNLTFRDLSLVEDAMIARLNAIHHSRIAYPKAGAAETETASASASADEAPGTAVRSA